MSRNLVDFLTELAENPQMVAEYKRDPKKVMADAGLSAEEQELMLQGDEKAVRKTIEDAGLDIAILVFVSVMVNGH